LDERRNKGFLDVTVDYIHIAQWVKTVRFLLDKIERELDRAAAEKRWYGEERRKQV
jgi:hypothetical protein